MHKSTWDMIKNHPDNPFKWKDNPRPSIFQEDSYFTYKGKTKSELSTAAVEKARSEGKAAGTIKNISRNKKAEAERVEAFRVFSQQMIERKKK